MKGLCASVYLMVNLITMLLITVLLISGGVLFVVQEKDVVYLLKAVFHRILKFIFLFLLFYLACSVFPEVSTHVNKEVIFVLFSV